MKKLFICLLSLILCLSTFACKHKKEDSINLQYGVKYIHSLDTTIPEEEQRYYIFYKNGTAKYHHYYNYVYDYDPSRSYTQSYTIEYICDYVPEDYTVFCAYNSVEYDEVDTRRDVTTTDIECIEYSKNYIMELSGYRFIAENYLNENLSNYGK